MIRPADVPPLLMAAFPAFCLEDEALDFPPSDYLVLADFARQAVAAAQAGTLDDFPALFLMAERILEEGDEDAQTLLAAGLLEDLQSAAVRAAEPGSAFDPDIFVQWLLPKTRQAWTELLTSFRGDPPDLKSVVLALGRQRDTRSMSKAELRAARRLGRRHHARR